MKRDVSGDEVLTILGGLSHRVTTLSLGASSDGSGSRSRNESTRASLEAGLSALETDGTSGKSQVLHVAAQLGLAPRFWRDVSNHP